MSNVNVDEWKRQANEVLDRVDAQLTAYPLVQQAATATKQRPAHLAK